MIDLLSLILATAAAFLGGFVDAIAGGGGVITVPALLMLGLPPDLVVGTNKIIGTTGTSAAAFTFLKRSRTNREILRFTVPMAACGAVIGAASVEIIPIALFKPILILVIYALALYFFFRPALGITASYTGLSSRLVLVTSFAVFVICAYDGLFGPGTGAFLTALMVRFVGLDFVFAAGNTRVLNWTSNIVSLVIFIGTGKVIWAIGLPMAFGNLLGGFCGAHVAIEKGAPWIRWIYIAMGLALATKMLA